MIFTYNIISGKVKLDAEKIFTMASKTMRSHQYKMQKKRMTKSRSLNVFSNRIIDDWNKLPAKIVTSSTKNVFKRNLEEHWKEEMFWTPF